MIYSELIYGKETHTLDALYASLHSDISLNPRSVTGLNGDISQRDGIRRTQSLVVKSVIIPIEISGRSYDLASGKGL